MVSAETAEPAEKVQKKKVWILGGGLGGLSAAWAFSQDVEARSRFEVHLFQMGWRLGGKGRTGRDPHDDFRVIEHGLHAFGGYYHNTFRVLRDCAEDEEIHKLFEPEQRVAFPIDVADDRNPPRVEMVAFDWPPFRSDAPDAKPRLPGRPGEPPNVATLIARLLMYLDRLTLFEPGPGLSPSGLGRGQRPLTGLAELQLREVAGRSLDRLPSDTAEGPEAEIESMLSQAADVARDRFSERLRSPGNTTRPQEDRRSLATIGQLARATLSRLEALSEPELEGFELYTELDEITPEQRRALWRTITRVCLASVVGILSSGADRNGLETLNCLDFREFLQLNGASRSTVQSGIIKGIYDYVFAYEDGHPDHPKLAAGVAVRFMLLFFLDSDGGMQWHMTRGMGESVVLPLYQALKARGVQFHFYREVSGLSLSDDGRRISKISLRRQVDSPPIPRADEVDPYLSKYEAGGETLLYWPAHPPPATLDGVAADRLADRAGGRADYGLEGPVPGAEPFPEETHEDFDAVILAIPPAAQAAWLPSALRDEWGLLTDPRFNVETVSAQIWTARRSALKPFFCVGSDERPFPSIADMSHQLRYDRTDAHGLFFLVGQAERVAGQSARQSDKLAHEAARRFIQDDPGGLATKLGFDAPGVRVHAQANRLPSDLYCLSVPHTVNRRPHAAFQKVENLALAGDWVRTGLDFGCAESAVLSGLQAANKFRRVEGIAPVSTYVPGAKVERASSTVNRVRPSPVVAAGPIFDFQSCSGYAFFGVVDDQAQFLKEAGLRDARINETHHFSNPRGVRFWLVRFHDVINRQTGERLDDYTELSMAYLVDVHDLAGQVTCSAWHLPVLYLTSPVAQRVGVEDFGLPKRLADVRIFGDRHERSIRVVDPETDALIVGLDVQDLDLQEANIDQAKIEGLADPQDVNAIFNYDPNCVQYVKSADGQVRIVSPQLQATLGRSQMATSARITPTFGPDVAPPFQWRYHFTSFVLRTDFTMTLRVKDRVC